MKAVSAYKGKIGITEIEITAPPPGHVLIRTEYSAISPGTELSFLRRTSDQQVILGYSAVGIVEQLGEGVAGITAGQRVACYGAPYVKHAEMLTVPCNLTAPVPDHVSPEEAAFAGLGAIAIHALRTAELRFGESAVVVGLGILGQMIGQIASAAAFRVIGLDLSAGRAELLNRPGKISSFASLELMEEHMREATGGYGADSVLLCAGGPGEELINQSLGWIRDRGNIVIVGDMTTSFSRGLMFAKEAQVLISRAGGPGRYDSSYERDNRDYPIAHVRWTEGRNIGEYVRLLAERRIEIRPLITNIVPFEQAEAAYGSYEASKDVMGTLLRYGT
ncbi:zinc-binding alcohol dehydrogenase [Paenibacillus sp. N4]|uniref:zinc-dependent alcohol dehydrogenase n=1 Tax=Paenibacillus vietnamensis TaxID=2590547 RepID=UPI001CD18832|nr:zinc-binding alcohol dehydrogenase [Paenibacillus vietnamensis]MCA0754270.1 zinc-binding alcohol dehydrogenase [Paenibacillus vietnamensis]